MKKHAMQTKRYLNLIFFVKKFGGIRKCAYLCTRNIRGDECISMSSVEKKTHY